ncbi:type I-E CRISPR-associated protein Cse2/CasB [Nocardia colli]|uniref:type I-E CRISPR-associated protein Cse2/CasB n=1 Tax=Nocardia colli TaxID=2545717 RepID=UPI0035DB5C19
MSESDSTGFFWSDRSAWRGRRPSALALTRLRRGAGQSPGAVPGLWEYYRAPSVPGRMSVELHAEHITLGLFAAHQRARRATVHVAGREFAAVLGRLRALEPAAVAGLDRRFAAAVASPTRCELADHLHSLIARLGRLLKNGFDYDQLYQDIREWENPDSVPGIRRRWGSRYFIAERAGMEQPATAFLASLSIQEPHDNH